MPLIQPFAGLRPVPEHVADVIAPPYDVLNTEEARERATGRPLSFLHVSKPEIDLEPDIDPYDPAVYQKGAGNFRRMIEQGVLQQDAAPWFYVYRLTMDEHRQTGLVAGVSVAAYNANRIRKHEFTRPQKEDDRVRQIEALAAQTGPVFLSYPNAPAIDAKLAKFTDLPGDVDVTADDGVRHELWVVARDADIQFFIDEFEVLPALYVADGHHRSAAAARVAKTRGDEAAQYFLSVLFPHHQMQILDYNRVVCDLNGLTEQVLVARISTDFDVVDSKTAVCPSRSGEFGMYLPGHWYRLTIYPERIPADDPVASLDVSLLSDTVLAPVLGVKDLRRDSRIDFVGGIRGLQELERRVDSGGMAVAFSLFPTQMDQLMRVADSGEVMPPKSTWFEPKLADGMVSLMY
ncbi:MAG: DUF1015 family protein [Gammaproteobacteria bacterium]|nr:MAG: DUF1015 family protein [Gammaproteobacteria bacterium]